MNVGSLFSGIGLLDYGLHLAGLEHSWFCEADEFRRGILARRWPGARVLDDVRSLRGGDIESVDLVAGGFPCKGASTAGKRTGFGHPETVLWREQARILGELRPRYAVVENVANILGLHDGAVWGEVLGDLAALGYGFWWDCLPAAAFGAPHLRDRVFLVAHANESRTDAHAATGRPRAAVGERDRAAADARSERRQQDARGAHGDEAAALGARWVGTDADNKPVGVGAGRLSAAREIAPDPASERREGARAERPALGRVAPGRGVAVDWGDYLPAIERWERIHGCAPEPLVRRVDARGAARVERSRLSALGDGVLVQAGYLVGRMIVDHAASPPSSTKHPAKPERDELK